MNKEELMLLVIRQLRDRLKDSPECFDIQCDEVSALKAHNGTTIMWRPRFDMGDDQIINDPINIPSTIILVYNKSFSRLECYVFMKDVSLHNTPASIQADGYIEIEYHLPKILYTTYRKFKKLKNALVNRHKEKENDKFLKKFMSVFPSTFDDKLLK